MGRAFGGVERHIISLAKYLVARNHSVTLAILGPDVFKGRLDGLECDINVASVPVGNVEHMSFRQASRLLSGLGGEACVFEKPGIHVGSVALDFAARLKFKRFLTVEQTEAEPLPAKTSRRHLCGLVPGIGLWWHRRRVSGYVRSLGPHKIICVSRAVQSRLQRDYLFPGGKLVLACNGVDTKRFVLDENARHHMRKELGATDATVVYGSVGRFAPVKRLEVAITSFARLVKERPQRDMRLLLVGEGPDAAKLRSLVHEHNVEQLVSIRSFMSQPWDALSGMDIFLLPSANEGLPFALLEAMSCERYVIATDVSGNSEVLGGDAVGALVSRGDDEAFFRAMDFALSATVVDRRNVGIAARKRVEQRFSLCPQLETITALLES
jgi:glycosyltransferase involved in cell wall biosynthesis